MAWIERFTCDICGKLRGDAENWWVAANECASPAANGPTQPGLKLMPWDNTVAHSAGSRHLCGAGCVHTNLDRWMTELRTGIENCPE